MYNLNALRYLDLINASLATARSVVAKPTFSARENAWFRAPLRNEGNR